MSDMLCAHGKYLHERCTACDSYETRQAPIDRALSAMSHQEGGSHYKDMPIQPVEYIHKNNIDYFAGNVIKYVSRHRNKNKASDVRKAIHYCRLILQLEYGETE